MLSHRPVGSPPQPPERGWTWGRTLLGLVLLAVFLALVVLSWQGNGWERLLERQQQLESFYAQHPLLVLLVAGVLYALVTGLSIPGATVLSLIYAWQFGFWVSLPLVSLASTAGATLAFWSSRYLLRDVIRARLGDQLPRVQASLDRDGPRYLFLMRLVPAFPFFLVNVLMGLTTIGTWTFWWVSQLGMLPGTAVYLFAGSRIPDLASLREEGIAAVFSPAQLLQIGLALTLLGGFPWAAKWLTRRWRGNDGGPASDPPGSAS